MPSSSQRFLSLPFILLLLLASTATASSSPNPTASILCRHSDTPLLCLRIAAPLRIVNPLTITEAAIKITTKVAVRAKAEATFLSLLPRQTPLQKARLETCAESYGDVVDGLRDSAISLAMSRMKAEVMNYLSAASFGVTVCEDAFKDVPRGKFPLGRVNKTLRNYVSNALAMGDQLSLHW
ncbi:pectinesterase inhibitor [Phalaenopsis equestris]|uniref:pectinesterase inhibitor n=1 Tax=Phalaenopsis equestris TaxID=78828 RepID=UPI0009E5BDF4|nr:pectinesterase inhibitor [Phalaenopsis equestris]